MSYMQSFSSLLTNTTSRVANFTNTIVGNEKDGDTDDDTHLCRVLRAYYKDEKKQPFPAWLPPDPRAPQQAPAQPIYAPVGAGYGGGMQGSEGGSGLSSLWGSQPPSQNQSQSLRRPNLGGPQRSDYSASSNGRSSVEPPKITQHALPSQREGSHQGRSARDRLKANLRKESPGPQAPSYGRQGSYNSTTSASSYDNRSYPRGGGGSQPMTSANAPWDTGDNEFGGGGYTPEYDASRNAGRRQGLPAGPSSGRQGLPSGPRGYR